MILSWVCQNFKLQSLNMNENYSVCRMHPTYIALTQLATEAWDTNTLEVVESVQTGGSILTRTGLTFIYFRLAPETHQKVFAKC